MGCDRLRDSAEQGPELEGFVVGNSHVVGAIDRGGEANMRTVLAHAIVAEFTQGFRNFRT